MDDIEVKIHTEYSNYREKFYGFTLRQIIFGIILIVVAVVTYIYSLPYLGEDIASYLVIIISVPIAFLGFIPVQGLDAEKIIPYWWRNYMKFVKPLKYKTDKQILQEKNEKSTKYRYLEDGTVEKLTKAERKEKIKILKEQKKQEKIKQKAKKNEKKKTIDNGNTIDTKKVTKKQLREIKKQEKERRKQEKLLLKAKKKFGTDVENEELNKVELVPPKEEKQGIDDKEENSNIYLDKEDIKENEENAKNIEYSKTKANEIDFEEQVKKFEMFEKFKQVKPNATEEEFEKFYQWKEANK